MNTLQKVKQTALNRGLSIEQVADKATQNGVKVSKSTIYTWNTKEPSAEKIKAVADVLGVSVDYLLGNTDEMHPKQEDASAENADLKKYFDENIPLQFDGREIPQEDLKIIKRILESMDDE